ncbi:MAG: hypothetical protein S4CHLAM7_03520 [Chlamydiae bacterium]|nr:hypothetical protein [Chlamydiota bacterium]
MIYRPRCIEQTVKRFLNAFPVVGITGPRQSGKSTLLIHLLKDFQYVTFDDEKNIQFFEDDPASFLEKYSKKVIFDEVQRVPKLFQAIKLLVDKNRSSYGNFVLTGSTQFAFLKSASESLAGRIGLISLLPFQYHEMPKSLVEESIFKGSYPELVLRDYLESSLWYSSYVNTYLQKDLRALANIGDIRDFRRFVQLLAAQVSQVLDMTHYARNIGVSVPTIKRWLSILEASYILFLVPPYFNNMGKRIIKSPKIYFYDTGLVSYLTGIETFNQYDKGPLAGPLFENYVISEIYKRELHLATDAQLYYFRTQDQAEIDLIVDRKNKQEWIEIKKSSSIKPSMLRHLKMYAKEEDSSYLIYQGKEDLHKGIKILPLEKYLSYDSQVNKAHEA